jgi:hypothetical protein
MRSPWLLIINVKAAAALFFLAVSTHSAFGQPPCTVQEERRWRTLTAHFSTGSTTASLTLPTVVLYSDFPTVFLEVSNGESADVRQEMFIESGGEKAILTNGSALHLAPGSGERIIVSLTTRDGQHLCSWQPSLVLRNAHAPSAPDGFNPAAAGWFHKTGDPILLRVGGDQSREFRIDGLPAMVLARTPWEVILRDPRPMPGPRTVESQGYAITLRFIDIELHLSKPSSNGRATLAIKVPKLDLWGRPQYPPFPYRAEGSTTPLLTLINFNQDAISLLCGKSYSHPLGLDFDETRQIRITEDKIRNGVFTFNCPVRVRKPGLTMIEVGVYEPPPYHPPEHPNRHFPGLSFPR